MPHRLLTTAISIAPLALLVPAAPGQSIYDNLSRGTDGVAFVGDLVLDDLNVEGGGLLQSVTVALTAEGGGGTVTTGVSLSLAVDGGDGFPDLDGTGDDSFLFQAFQEVEVGGVTEVPFDVSGFWALVPEGALLFGGVMIDNPQVGHLFHGDPDPGSTDGVVFSFMNMGPVPVPSVSDPRLADSDGLSFRIEAVPLPGPAKRAGVIGGVQDFEGLAEGFHGMELTVDGVMFSDGRDGFPPPADATFAIDDGTGAWNDNPGMLDFVSGKLLQINTFSNGPGYSFSALKSMRFTPDRVHTAVRLSVAYVVEIMGEIDFSSSDITLLALLEGEMVATDVIHPDTVLGQSGGGSFTFGAGALEISGVAFDSLVLFNNGPGRFGTVQMGLDNLVIGEAACAADLDLDGDVDVDDLVGLVLDWGCTDPPGPCPGDVNGDGLVNVDDLVDLILLWGPCPG